MPTPNNENSIAINEGLTGWVYVDMVVSVNIIHMLEKALYCPYASFNFDITI